MSVLEASPMSDAELAEPIIAGLQLGEVRVGADGNLQAYFGGETVSGLELYDNVTLRNGRIAVAMYTIDDNDKVDYAEVTIKTPLTASERGRALRGGGFVLSHAIERTPVQYFVSERAFMDIPISGRARWLAVDPDGVFSEGLFDDSQLDMTTRPARFGKGWTFVWIAEGSRPFKFGELCSPRFIDQTDEYPSGEDGIRELDHSVDFEALPAEFQEKFALYMSGEHLRTKAA